ncbi:MAG TPA: DUF192 domain-containing protein [Nitrospiraceae bacterium]|nr:DUF192 domain-containing protein [Nitrospiraceae bacterium]
MLFWMRELLFTCLLALALCLHARAMAAQDGLVQISTPTGAIIQAEVADTTEKRAKGLMYRDSLPQDRGMLFTFAEPQLWTFWMKNTRISLDIIWMDGKKRIVHIERNVPTCPRTDDGCPQYQPNDNAVYVLELAAGVADALKLQRGSVLKFQTPS